VKDESNYFDSEEFQAMLHDYEQGIKEGYSVFLDADDLADIADYYQQEERFEDAQKVVDRVVELHPDSIIALDYIIHNALNEGDFDTAEQNLQKMEDHEAPEYIYSRAEIWLTQGNIEQADKYLHECFKDVEPDEYQDYVLDVANLYTDYGYNEKAMEWMMLARHENTADFKELMGRTLFGLGKYDDSERLFNELIDRDPFQKRYWNALANAQFMKMEYDAAISSSEYAIAIDPNDAEGLLAKANGLYYLENYEEALDFFQRYEKVVPDDEFGLLHQGICLINLNRYEEAVDILRHAIEVSPQDSPILNEIYQELSYCYCELKMTDSALYCIEQAERYGCDPADVNVFRGHILLSNNRIVEAEAAYKKAISEAADPQHTILRVIVSIYDCRFVEMAYKMFLNYFSQQPAETAVEGYSYMALCCYDLKRSDEFITYLKKACEVNPQEAKAILGHLFPRGMKPSDYYSYMIEKSNK
jgi:tetratricopeptide (TPR) repeat protein